MDMTLSDATVLQNGQTMVMAPMAVKVRMSTFIAPGGAVGMIPQGKDSVDT